MGDLPRNGSPPYFYLRTLYIVKKREKFGYKSKKLPKMFGAYREDAYLCKCYRGKEAS